MKSAVLLLAAVLAADCLSYFDLAAEEWHAFKLKYDKSYENEAEDRDRMTIFTKNKHYVAQHNQRFERGEVTFRVALNQFSDMSTAEFARTMNGLNSTTDQRLQHRSATYVPPANVEIPARVDWRTAGAVTAVKDQGSCGSCWAFSSTGALEGQHFRKTRSLVSLSEQNLVDCSWIYGNHGCNGGYMNTAFIYVRDAGGIATETSYPYEGRQNIICRYNPFNSGATDVGYVAIPKRNENWLKKATATVGPVSVGIDASLKSFQFYSSGIYYDKGCSETRINHAVLVVGYGTNKVGGDYWLVKNSWSTSWGNKGYVKLARNRNNHCGIATMASYPLV